MSNNYNDRFLEDRYEHYLEQGMSEAEAAKEAKLDLFMDDDDSWREYDIDDNFEEEVWVFKYTYGKYFKIDIEATGPEDFFDKLSKHHEVSWLVNGDSKQLRERFKDMFELKSNVDDIDIFFKELVDIGQITIWQ